MKKFHFKLEPLLKLRRSQRDGCRRLLAKVLLHDQQLLDMRSETETNRRSQIDELRTLEGEGRGVNIDASVSRRSYAGQLSGDLGEIDARRAALAKQIDLCRQAVIRADQAVKSLEKLAEQQHAEFVYQEERKEAIELEQTWLGIHAVSSPREHAAP